MPDSSNRPGGGRPPQRSYAPQAGGVPPLFDPSKPPAELFDSLAEKQAEQFQASVKSSQLRRFFGEVKDLYRQLEALTAGVGDQTEHARIYREQIEPRFKMVRSKVSYAGRPGGQAKIPAEFASFLTGCIQKVGNHEQFRLFVLHFEAVVGFMYGKGKVS